MKRKLGHIAIPDLRSNQRASAGVRTVDSLTNLDLLGLQQAGKTDYLLA